MQSCSELTKSFDFSLQTENNVKRRIRKIGLSIVFVFLLGKTWLNCCNDPETFVNFKIVSKWIWTLFHWDSLSIENLFVKVSVET